MIDEDRFIQQFKTCGYSIIQNVLPLEYIRHAREELQVAIEKEAVYHGTRQYSDYGMVLLCSLYGGSFLELFEIREAIQPFETILGEGCIVYAYTSSSMPPHGSNYANRIHTDCPRLIPDYVTNVGATILLDDFTETNGATWFLPGSHTRLDPPTEDEFFSNATRLVAQAGSIFYFNARLWHYGGENRTGQWRHALTVNMGRPFMKQRIDIPRAMSNMDLSGVSERILQKLGFYAQVPASYDEYYLPPEQRKFKQKAE